MCLMAKRSWSKGRKEATKLIRVTPEIHAAIVKAADAAAMPIKEWVCNILKKEISRINHA